MITRAQVRQFLAVVDGGSFTRAAALINVTQPTLSIGISELEKHLGTKLFIREKRRIRLTEAGNRFLIHARKIQKEFRRAEDETIASNVLGSPILLGVMESISSQILEDIITKYQRTDYSNPISIIEGTASELSNSLAKGRIDAALTMVSKNIITDNMISLFDEPYMLMVSNRHRLAERQIISTEEISSETMIARRSCELLSETSKFFTSHGVRPPFSLRSPHEDRAMAMVRANLGMTIAPKSHQIEGISAIQLEGFQYNRTIVFAFGQNWEQKFGANHNFIEIIKTKLRVRIT